MRVDVLDASPHIERVVVLLDLLIGVEGLAVAEFPLAFALALGRAGLGGLCHWSGSFVEPAFGSRVITGRLSGGADPAAS
jgi:hypothetical protein